MAEMEAEAEAPETVLTLQAVQTEPRKMLWGRPDDTLREDLEQLRDDFTTERSLEAWYHMMAYAAEGLVEVVRVPAGTAPPDAVAVVGDGRNLLVKAFLVRLPGTVEYPHPRPAWGWVSRSVPPELASDVRCVLDPLDILDQAGTVRRSSWDIAPNSEGAMRTYA